jgi:MFS family permease
MDHSFNVIQQRTTRTRIRNKKTKKKTEPKKAELSYNVSSFRSSCTSQAARYTLPIRVLVVVASLDAADKQLLASSFPMLEKTLGWNVQTLGYFSLFTSGSYALSLPFWGYLVHRYGLAKLHLLLSMACLSWGVATMGIAVFGHSVVGQAVFRTLVGVALGSILPLSQTLLMELIDTKLRGRSFGLMGMCEKLAGTLAAASVVYLDDCWEMSYYALGIGSMGMGWMALSALHLSKLGHQHHLPKSKGVVDQGPELTLRQISQRIVQLPAFLCLVAQGIFGGTPWDRMSFLLLLMDWKGFTRLQIVCIQFTSGLTSIVGGWLGGLLGDYAAHHMGTRGRIALAFVSLVGGIPFYGLYLYATDYSWALLWINLFQLWATWCKTGALRPICADLTRNLGERAQIVSLWIVLEKIGVFGAPLVGYLTSNILATSHEQNEEGGASQEKAQALAFNLFFLSSLFWAICACFGVLMAFTMKERDYYEYDILQTSAVGGRFGTESVNGKTLVEEFIYPTSFVLTKNKVIRSGLRDTNLESIILWMACFLGGVGGCGVRQQDRWVDSDVR